jgi:ADP-heptose:LPS heptosyltransferase
MINSISPTEQNWWRVRNLLVIRLDNIGDIIMLSPALRSLKENLPQVRITLMASPAGSTAAALLPEVDEVLTWRSIWQDLSTMSFDPLKEWQLVTTLKAKQFDAAIIFTSFSQSPHPAGLICALAGIPLRLGESKELDFHTLTSALPAASDSIHQVDRNLRLIEWLGFRVSDRSIKLSITVPLGAPPPYILLNPWTSCAARTYPPDRFAIAAQQLSEITNWSVVVTGVAKDRDRAQPLLEILGERGIDRIGSTNLAELAALVAQAQLVLTNNTSVLHLADATKTPMIVTFSGTDLPSQWCPRYAPARLLYRRTDCSPCYALTCPFQLECLDISPDEIVEAALELLSIQGDREWGDEQ